MSDKIDDIVIPILRNLQTDLASVRTDISVLKSDVAVLKENTGKIEIRLKVVESHMSGFMTSARYLEHEIDSLRGRVEALEAQSRRDPEAPR